MSEQKITARERDRAHNEEIAALSSEITRLREALIAARDVLAVSGGRVPVPNYKDRALAAIDKADAALASTPVRKRLDVPLVWVTQEVGVNPRTGDVYRWSVNGSEAVEFYARNSLTPTRIDEWYCDHTAWAHRVAEDHAMKINLGVGGVCSLCRRTEDPKPTEEVKTTSCLQCGRPLPGNPIEPSWLRAVSLAAGVPPVDEWCRWTLRGRWLYVSRANIATGRWLWLVWSSKPTTERAAAVLRTGFATTPEEAKKCADEAEAALV